jgi:hypothetical protein
MGGDGKGRDLEEARDIHRAHTDRVSLLLVCRPVRELSSRAAFDFVLLGVMWTQLWSYVMTSRRDKRLNRIIVVSRSFSLSLSRGSHTQGISTFVASATSI